jgi:uncharacterized membrane protein YGL010W
MVFYLTLSFTIAAGMLAVSAIMVYPLTLLGGATLPIAVAVFVVAWIGQFVGHRIEGRMPSLLGDVRFLLAVPARLLADRYRGPGVACRPAPASSRAPLRLRPP